MDDYSKWDQYYNGICQHIASLVDTIVTGTKADWETSETICIGGSNGQYTSKSPFIGACEWKVDIASSGQSQAQIIVSNVPHQGGVDFTGATQSYTESAFFNALVINIPPNTTIPVDSEWYQLQNGQTTVFVTVVASANAAFANIQYRQKRGGNGSNSSH